MDDKIILLWDIKHNGMRVPIDLVVKNGEIYLYDGARRLIISKVLGKRHIVARVFLTEERYAKFKHDEALPDFTIHGRAVNQFMELGYRSTDKYWAHRYTLLYDKFFKDKNIKKVLEIGVQRGASLLLWKEVFPKAHIYGVDRDITKAHLVKNDTRITLLQGRAEDKKFMNKVASYGNFDLIVDDAGHRNEQQRNALFTLWNKLNPGGWYVVEDIYTSYYRGDFNKNGSMVDILKTTIDKLVYSYDVASIHFYYGICFIEKQ